ncbi:Ribosomal large subunit pseudouridine synthase D [hydrothermal vent metagenome]|uniref:Ribosomal large subunit pseudouridine synthase D n=1 Tax=hydrothermal vent metagenome TaxID=652676 RepID=A0A3B0UDN4_9ZZZZ
MRLDLFLARSLAELSRTRIKQLILAGQVMVGGDKLLEPKHRVKPGYEICVTKPPPVDPIPKGEPIELDILFEDDHLIVINKPAFLVVHPAPGAPDGTLVNALIHHCGASLSGIGGVRRPGIVHRLDKNTTGVMVVAKTEKTHRHLAAQFADHGRNGPLSRKYHAFVWGHHQSFAGKIDAPLGRDPRNRLKQAVRRDGRKAITHFKTLTRYAGQGWDIAKLQCELETGRTHQIRVHMAHVGHPVIGDPVYATGFATKALALPEPLKTIITCLPRQALHAAQLGFEHPESGQELCFSAPLPDDLALLEENLTSFSARNLS